MDGCPLGGHLDVLRQLFFSHTRPGSYPLEQAETPFWKRVNISNVVFEMAVKI